jgi:putative ABC transport system ATP-binding protein
MARDATAVTLSPVISLRGVQKTFLTTDVETHALSDISLEILQGEYVSIAGPSGCGKTTLLSILGLLDAPTRGEYILAGEPVESLTPVERAHVRNQRIGFVFQSYNLVGDLTVFENVDLPLHYRTKETAVAPASRRALVQQALERVGMNHRMNHYPAQLSGGQQQRVAVARAIAGGPAVLLADEPTGNLDSQNGELIMNLLGELHQAGTTICIVTHDPRYAGLAARTIQLFDGRIVADGAGAPASASANRT